QEGRRVRLMDGGVYDNMGLEPLDDLSDAMLVALNAGGVFHTGRYGRIPVLRDFVVSQSLLYRQSTALRRRWMVERFRAWEDAPMTASQQPDEEQRAHRDVRRPWLPECLQEHGFTEDTVAALSYIIIDEIVDGMVGLVASGWPAADGLGRLRFPAPDQELEV